LFFKPSQALNVETPTPLADDLAWRIELCRDRVIGHALARQQHNLGADNITIARRVPARTRHQFRPFRFAQFDIIRTLPRHDVFPQPRTGLTDSRPSGTKYVTVFMKLRT
jgi:hypothetical protein